MGGERIRGKHDTSILIKIFINFLFSELKPIEHIRNLDVHLSCLATYPAQPLFVQQLWEEILGRSKQRVVFLHFPFKQINQLPTKLFPVPPKHSVFVTPQFLKNLWQPLPFNPDLRNWRKKNWLSLYKKFCEVRPIWLYMCLVGWLTRVARQAFTE